MIGADVAHASALLGHDFARPALLAEALTHRSAVGRGGRGSNERLEFLGDRVLGLVVAEWLLERFPSEQEGQLGPRLASLVARPALAAIAAEVGLPPLIVLGAGEARAGVGRVETVAADALEAAIGALFLDGGLDAARRFIRAAWGERMAAQGAPPKDPKTALQEYALARAWGLPTYTLRTSEGPSHAPRFVISVSVPGTEAEGAGGSKREAERAAAAALVALLSARGLA